MRDPRRTFDDPDMLASIAQDTRDMVLGEKVREVQAARAEQAAETEQLREHGYSTGHNQYTPEDMRRDSDRISPHDERHHDYSEAHFVRSSPA